MFDSTMTYTHDAASRTGLAPIADDVTHPPEPRSPRVLVPNETTRAAMCSAERKAAGLEPDDSPVFGSVDDVMRLLEA